MDLALLNMGGPDMAPHTPPAPRPGGAGALRGRGSRYTVARLGYALVLRVVTREEMA
jgi:hypothetical protein